jgi:hypothetical protein
LASVNIVNIRAGPAFPLAADIAVYKCRLDEKQFARWVKQASHLPGEEM